MSTNTNKQTFAITRSTGNGQAQTERIAMNADGTLTNADETLDMSAWGATSTQEREAVYADVKATKFSGWQGRSTTTVQSALNGLNKE